ncbi:MotA/TolQ/ExbB proton channel family protein [Burkholderia oklahomensis]|uniref:MotA/TolQ/ExbB proton channel family protein n=1 Tax=Burkholderia oklahomensis TaxID=342113 RepID=UPI00264DE5EC|nr:MotA/TolQ/ExbB proton channel family protein [Burkholderia oklahomensis]MDN7673355.1 MotA/TolQ/ExbB proton channel family protein [Burkholderia oklahomensis]
MNPANVAAHLSPLQLFEQADWLVKSIMALLALASVASWTVIADKLLRFRALERRAARWLALLQAPRPLAALAQALGAHADDPFARVYRAVAAEWRESWRHGLAQREAGRDSLKERLARVGVIARGVEIERLQRGLPVLATVGSVAPFVGLFGTVWGIINAFQGIAATNDTSLAVVAPGIAEALFATALGLVAAIPAVVAYNRASGDLSAYANRLDTLTGLVEVQLSRQLDAGDPVIDAAGDADGVGAYDPDARDVAAASAFAFAAEAALANAAEPTAAAVRAASDAAPVAATASLQDGGRRASTKEPVSSADASLAAGHAAATAASATAARAAPASAPARAIAAAAAPSAAREAPVSASHDAAGRVPVAAGVAGVAAVATRGA